MDISDKRIVIVTHYLVYGTPQALREYLVNNKVGKLLFIAHPLEGGGDKSYIENIVKDEPVERRESKIRTKIPILNHFLEVFLTLKWFFKEKQKFDLWIGVDSLNAFVGVFFKKIGKVRKVVFYTIDYVPQRFDNKILNNIYHRLDKYCVKNVDETWNVSLRIAEGREKIRGLKQSIYNNQKVVPIGIWFNKVRRLSFDKIKKHQLLFIGHLLEKQGVQLVLEAIPKIVESISDFHFLVIGGGEYESKLREKTKELNIEEYVTFAGWIKDRNVLEQIMMYSAVAVAMYNGKKDSFTYYADPTKLKDYLSAGLPVLLTDVPHNAKEIEKNKCGIVIDYDKNQIASTVIKLMRDEKRLQEYRRNGLEYVRQFDWNLIFKENLARILS